MSAWSEAAWIVNQLKNKIDTSMSVINNKVTNTFLSTENNTPSNATENSIWFIE
jgi:hypothetical protein